MKVLDDKVAIVTGSARGIGRATAELLAEQGAKVLINDLDGDVAQQTAGEIDGETLVFAGDLTEPGMPDKLVEAVIGEWGKVDILVNNAGYTLDAPIHKMSDEWFQKMLDIHSVVPFRMCRAVAPHMREPAKKEREEGIEVFRKIVNVSSISGTMGNAGQANYSSGKSAVVGLTKTLAKEWGQFKINVNAVAFGFIETRLTAAKDDENVAEIGGEKVQLGIPEQLRSLGAMVIPLGRPGQPHEAAGGVFFLCTPWSNFVHRPGAERHRRSVHRDDLVVAAAAASTNHSNTRRNRGSTRHSSCSSHCTASTGRPGISIASATPSADAATTARPSPRWSIAWWWNELTSTVVASSAPSSRLPRAISISWRGCGGGGEPATDEASTSFHLAHPGSLGCASASRLTSWASVPPRATLSTWMPRHMPRIGIPRSSARPTSSSSKASRWGSVAASSGWGSWP